jgi:hypothetical protein
VSAQPNLGIVTAEESFDYGNLDAREVNIVRAAAARINESVKRQLKDLVAMGKDLELVKNTLPRGVFQRWVPAELGWSKKWADQQISVANWLDPKHEQLAHLNIDPSAAYLLVAPRTPEAAREEALKRARKGEHITGPVAQAIAEEVQAKEAEDGGPKPVYRLRPQLNQHLSRCLQRWDESRLGELVEQLRDFADAVEMRDKENRKKAQQ